MSPSTPPSPRDGIRNTTVEALVAAIILGLGLVTATESWRLGARWTDDGPGAGYFPFYIALVMILASAGILIQALRSRRSDTDLFVDRASLRQVLQVLVPAVLYVLAVQFVGIYLASALYIALFMVLLGRFGWVHSLAVGLGVSAVFFVMFEVWFKVPLFKGALNPTAFLGY